MDQHDYYMQHRQLFNIWQMNQEKGSKYNSHISNQSLKSRNSGSMSLGRPSFSQRNPSLSKKQSLVYVMSIQRGRRSDDIDRMLEESSYQISNKMPWNRNSDQNQTKLNILSLNRSASNQNRIKCHTCDCYPNCKGQQCSCYSARTEICIKDSCCQTCIQMKNTLLMADRGQFCNCKNNQCLKSQCKCLRSNGVCTSLCKCQNCKNTINSKQRAQIIQKIKNGFITNQQQGQRKFCTCKKTKCNKKYCSCFANGIKCSKYCQCQNCINCDIIDQPMNQERPPSFYNQQQFANIQMPERMSFQKVEFIHYTK